MMFDSDVGSGSMTMTVSAWRRVCCVENEWLSVLIAVVACVVVDAGHVLVANTEHARRGGGVSANDNG